MNPVDKYRKKMLGDKHESLNVTEHLLDDAFQDSPLFRNIDVRVNGFHENINDVSNEFYIGSNNIHEARENLNWNPFKKTGVRFNTNRDGSKEALMRSGDMLNKGDIIKERGKFYFVREIVDKQTYPVAKLLECNSNFPIDINGETFYEPCFVEFGRNKVDFDNTSNKYMILDTSRISVIIQYNNFSKNIYETDEVEIGRGNYRITGIDMITDVYDEEGLLNLELEKYSKNSSDHDGEEWESGW